MQCPSGDKGGEVFNLVKIKIFYPKSIMKFFGQMTVKVKFFLFFNQNFFTLRLIKMNILRLLIERDKDIS